MTGPRALVAAPDKFAGTASAREVAHAAVEAARRCGWTGVPIPLSDGGEGLLDVVGGEPRTAVVPGPFGAPVEAEWRWLSRPADGGAPTAVIEMARVAGRDLVPGPSGLDPLRAGTAGVGELVRVAAAAGARRIVVGCGGSATTDGGWGAVTAIGSAAELGGAAVVVACDVTTPFLRAAEVFGPQKGATPSQVGLLGRRLAALADRYRRQFGVDVTSLPGSGAAGGLAGGLAAVGATLVPGFELVAGLAGLAPALETARAVVTGEGALDETSLAGKVVGGVVTWAGGRLPVLCVAGRTEPAVRARLVADGVAVVDLSERVGVERARRDVLALVAEAVTELLSGS